MAYHFTSFVILPGFRNCTFAGSNFKLKEGRSKEGNIRGGGLGAADWGYRHH